MLCFLFSANTLLLKLYYKEDISETKSRRNHRFEWPPKDLGHRVHGTSDDREYRHCSFSAFYFSTLPGKRRKIQKSALTFLLPPASQQQTEKTCACVICKHPLYPTQNNVIFRKLMCKLCLVQVSPTLRRHVA